MPSKKGHRKSSKKDTKDGRIKIGYHPGTGQYRKYIKGKTYYFGSDRETALARYAFFLETGLVFKRGYRQFCRVQNDIVTPLGPTIEEARRNLGLLDAEADADGSSEPDSDALSVVAIYSGRDVGDAYCEWLHNHGKSALTIQDAVRAFDALLKHPKCGDVPIEQVNKAYFLRWRDHCHETVRRGDRQPTWANKRLAYVKAGFNRCNKEGWIYVPGLPAMLEVLESTSGPPQERAVFEPPELRAVIEAADPWLKTVVMLAINAGLGNTDIGHVQWGHFVNKKIRKTTETRFVMPRGKTWGRRRTPLWSETVQLLDEWRRHRKAKHHGITDENLVWTTRYGSPLVYSKSHDNSRATVRDNLQPAFKELVESAGLARPNLTFYSIRHTGATWATDYATDDAAVAEGVQFYLGDAPGEIWKNYAQGIPPSLRRVVSTIHDALFED